MTPEEEFKALVDQLRVGDPDAARVLVAKFGPYLLRVIRRRLHKKLRPKFDSLDFAQDVWASFFASPPAPEALDSPEHLIAFLETLARNKVVEVVRDRFHLGKYDIRREQQSLNDSRAAYPVEPLAPDGTPSTIAMTREEWDQLLRTQPVMHRQMFILRREGKTYEEIAAELGVNERTVRRVLGKFLPGARP